MHNAICDGKAPNVGAAHVIIYQSIGQPGATSDDKGLLRYVFKKECKKMANFCVWDECAGNNRRKENNKYMCTIEFLLLMRKNSRSFFATPTSKHVMLSDHRFLHFRSTDNGVCQSSYEWGPKFWHGDFVDVIDGRLRSSRVKIVQPRWERIPRVKLARWPSGPHYSSIEAQVTEQWSLHWTDNSSEQ